MGNFYHTAPDFKAVANINSTYFPHASEIRKSAECKAQVYTFENTHTWTDVGLQVLRRIGWRPERSRPQTLNLQRLTPPREFQAHFFADREHVPADRYAIKDGKQILMRQVTVTAGAVRADDIYSTIVTLNGNGKDAFTSGYVHGRETQETTPVYIQEVVVLHALRSLRDWITTTDQMLVQNIIIFAGPSLVHYHIKKWMQGGVCQLESAAASGITQEVLDLPLWLTPFSCRPKIPLRSTST